MDVEQGEPDLDRAPFLYEQQTKMQGLPDVFQLSRSRSHW